MVFRFLNFWHFDLILPQDLVNYFPKKFQYFFFWKMKIGLTCFFLQFLAWVLQNFSLTLQLGIEGMERICKIWKKNVTNCTQLIELSISNYQVHPNSNTIIRVNKQKLKPLLLQLLSKLKILEKWHGQDSHIKQGPKLGKYCVDISQVGIN